MTPFAPLLIATLISPADNALWQMTPQAWSNPAARQWMLGSTYNALSASYRSDRADEAVSAPADGTGERYWQASAESFTKLTSGALWGEASYRNGRQTGLRWNETSDAAIVYPYLTADSVGGNLSMERYAFSGGYGATVGRFVWGLSGGYTAGLYYRAVDPRPKNVTGRLDLALGAGWLVADGRYFAGARLGWWKYKQSNEIDFKSQTGVEKIYHLTGLGAHYSRFAGTGLDTYYTGSCPSLGLGLYPIGGRGLALTADASRLKLTKVLTDLNKLPLAQVSHSELNLQLSWLAPASSASASLATPASTTSSNSTASTADDWALTASLRLARRHGSEGLFGDASSSIYPQIGSLLMYADNSRSARLEGLWQRRRADDFILWIRPSLGYSHSLEAYRDPARQQRLNDISAAVSARLAMRLAGAWCGALQGSVGEVRPFDCRLALNDAEPTDADLTGLLRTLENSFAYASHRREHYGAGLEASRSLGRYALTASLSWQGTHYYYNKVWRHTVDAGLTLRF